MLSPDYTRPTSESTIAKFCTQVAAQIGARTLLPHAIINTIRISGTAVGVADTDLEVTIYTTEVGDAGSFPPHSDPLAVSITIFARPAGMTPLESAQSGSSVAISDEESEAWLRVCIGDDLADYAYHVPTITTDSSRSRKSERAHKHLFMSFIDRRGHHILAPDNFQWNRNHLASGRPPRKLAPNNDTDLRNRLATTGPFTDAEADRDLRTNRDGTWRIQLTGDHLEDCTPVARAAIEAAYQLFRVRGAIHTLLRPVRIIATPNDLQLHFRWSCNLSTFAITTTLPRSEQQFHSPATDPRRWMYHVAQDWDEELSTGWVRWAQRTRINGIVHLGHRREQPRSEYSPGGQLRPRVQNGLVSIPHGNELAMDTTTTYPANKLIAWHHERDIRTTPFVFAAHAVIAWTDTPGLASLDIFEALPDTPPFSLRRAAFHAIHDAADAGAHHITTTVNSSLLAELGFTTHTNGQHTLNVATMP